LVLHKYCCKVDIRKKCLSGCKLYKVTLYVKIANIPWRRVVDDRQRIRGISGISIRIETTTKLQGICLCNKAYIGKVWSLSCNLIQIGTTEILKPSIKAIAAIGHHEFRSPAWGVDNMFLHFVLERLVQRITTITGI